MDLRFPEGSFPVVLFTFVSPVPSQALAAGIQKKYFRSIKYEHLDGGGPMLGELSLFQPLSV